MHKNPGFTLVELIVAVAIIGILAGIAVPNLLGMLPMFRLKSAARTVITDMQYVRGRSASLNKEYKIEFTLATDEYVIFKGNKSYGSTVWTSEKQVSKLKDDNINIFSSNISHTIISVFFKPTGTVTGTTITLKNSKADTKTITISTNGRIKEQ